MQRTETRLWQRIMLRYSPVLIKLSVYTDTYAHVQVTVWVMICHFPRNLTNTVFLSRKHSYHKALTMYPGSTADIWLICVVSVGCQDWRGASWMMDFPAWMREKQLWMTPLTRIQSWSISHFAAPGLPPPISINPAPSKYSEWLNASPFCSHRTSQAREKDREAVLIHNKN